VTTSEQTTTRNNLNAARKKLTDFIDANPASPNSPQWQQFEQVVAARDGITLQINQVIAAQFPPNAPPNLDSAIADLGKKTADLTSLAATLAKIGEIVADADLVVQAGATVLGIVTAL
jgi:hypothetical protein